MVYEETLSEIRQHKKRLIHVRGDYYVKWIGIDGSLCEGDFREETFKKRNDSFESMYDYDLIKKDGTVEYGEYPAIPQSMANSPEWTGIKYLEGVGPFVFGIKKNGTVSQMQRYEAENHNNINHLKNWAEISGIVGYSTKNSFGTYVDTFVLGLKRDGHVVAGSNSTSDWELGRIAGTWRNVTSLVIYHDFVDTDLVGIMKDGTAVIVHVDKQGKCTLEQMCDIVDAAFFDNCLLGLKRDGTLMILKGKMDSNIWDCLSQWKNVAVIDSCYEYDFGPVDECFSSAWGLTYEGKMLRMIRSRNFEMPSPFQGTVERICNYYIERFITKRVLRKPLYNYENVTSKFNIF